MRKEAPRERSMGEISGARKAVPLPIGEISKHKQERIDTGTGELNRVLGGGLVPGSLVLIGGEPGIGKSTLMLQIALHIKKLKVLYISGEESDQQIRMRAERIGIQNTNYFIFTETSTQNIFSQIYIKMQFLKD